MSQSAFRSPGPSVIVLGLLLLSAAGATAGEKSPRFTPARPGFPTFASPQAADKGATLRSEDLVKWGVVSITKSGCHASSLCPPSYASCASWSGPSVCGASYCQDESFCGDQNCENGCGPSSGPANHTPYEQYQVCFDQFGNSCTSWISYDAVFCGC